MVAGVALLDYDGDGWLDIYLVNGAAIPSLQKESPAYWNRLYRNNHDGTFTDVTERAGLADTTTERSEAIAAERNRRVKTVAFALVAGLVLAAATVVLSGDVIVGIAVGAATYAVIDRLTKAWGGPSEPPANHRPTGRTV